MLKFSADVNAKSLLRFMDYRVLFEYSLSFSFFSFIRSSHIRVYVMFTLIEVYPKLQKTIVMKFYVLLIKSNKHNKYFYTSRYNEQRRSYKKVLFFQSFISWTMRTLNEETNDRKNSSFVRDTLSSMCF